MSENVSNQAATERVEPIDRSGTASGEFVAGASCRCSRCGIYRWYPPLMFLSTIMAGLFCWLYLTKPVFITGPGTGQMAEPQPAVQEEVPAPTMGTPPMMETPPTASLPRNLDPTMASLPGQAEPHGPGGDLRTNDILGNDGGTEMKPLMIKRDGPVLFKPFVVNEQEEAPDPLMEEEAGDDSLAEEEMILPDEQEEEAGTVSAVVDEPVTEKSFPIGASFMAEFSAGRSAGTD